LDQEVTWGTIENQNYNKFIVIKSVILVQRLYLSWYKIFMDESILIPAVMFVGISYLFPNCVLEQLK